MPIRTVEWIQKTLKAGIRHIKATELFELPAYTEDELPASPANATLLLDETRGVPAWFDRDHYERATFVDTRDVSTDTQTVENTTDETEIVRFTTNADAMAEGRVYIMRIFGNYSTAATSDDFTYRVYIGDEGFDPTAGEGTEVTAVTTVKENVSDGPWQMKTTMTVFTDAENGTIAAHSEGAFNNTKKDDHVAPVTTDTTTADEFAVTVEWNNAKAGNTMTRGQAYLQQQG